MGKIRFPSYRLKSLLMLIAVSSCLMAGATNLYRSHRQRQQVIKQIEALGGFTRYADQFEEPDWYTSWDPGPTNIERVLGPDSVRVPLVVDLKGTQAEDADVKRLLALPTVERVDLAGTNVTDAALGDLARMPELKMLSICDTKTTAAGRKRLRALRPDIELCVFRWVSCNRDFQLMHVAFSEDKWAAGERLLPFEEGGF